VHHRYSLDRLLTRRQSAKANVFFLFFSTLFFPAQSRSAIRHSSNAEETAHTRRVKRDTRREGVDSSFVTMRVALRRSDDCLLVTRSYRVFLAYICTSRSRVPSASVSVALTALQLCHPPFSPLVFSSVFTYFPTSYLSLSSLNKNQFLFILFSLCPSSPSSFSFL